MRGRWRGIGHTPLGALSVIALYAAVAIQAGLGLVSEDEDGIFTGPLSGLIILHVAAIVFYQFRGKHLTKPMITGRASLDPGTQPMRPGKWWVALICLAVAIGVVRWIVAGAPPFGHWSPPT